MNHVAKKVKTGIGLKPRMIGVGTSNPDQSYDQEKVADLFGQKSPRIRGLFSNSHIKKRHLYLPDPGDDGLLKQEDSATLRKKHLQGAIELGSRAVIKCLDEAKVAREEIDFISCVSSTGFICPGISSHLVKELELRPDVRRADILGMGCSGGMNGLHSVCEYTNANPGKKALLVSVEVCSAAYFIDGTIKTAVVNSLFGDGAAAVLITTDEQSEWQGPPSVMGFESEVITDNIDSLRYDLVDGMLSFHLDKEVPYVIGSNIHKPIQRLLDKNNLKLWDIDHWIIHSGGKKVIDSIKYNIGISSHDVRHTLAVLRDYGNMSSCSVIFTYEALRKEKITKNGDYGMLVAMGPGVAIETALLRW